MHINKISSSYITPKTTGYSSAACAGMAIISGISKNKYLKKTHKMFAYLTGITTVMHIGLIEYNHYKYKHTNYENRG